MPLLSHLRQWARKIKSDVIALWFAQSNPRTPWYAKALGLIVVAYALSPIDLIPDFIPVFGYLDDMVLLPALIWLTLRMLPSDVIEESRRQATTWLQRAEKRPKMMGAAIFIVLLWFALGLWLTWWFMEVATRRGWFL